MLTTLNSASHSPILFALICRVAPPFSDVKSPCAHRSSSSVRTSRGCALRRSVTGCSSQFWNSSCVTLIALLLLALRQLGHELKLFLDHLLPTFDDLDEPFEGFEGLAALNPTRFFNELGRLGFELEDFGIVEPLLFDKAEHEFASSGLELELNSLKL